MNLFLVDGNSYVYRAFYAIRDLSTSKGFPTNAVFGFTNMLMKVLREKRPDSIAVVFDSPEPTERHRLFADYKANRPETPDDLVVQLPLIRDITRALGIAIYEMPGYEADDIIGTIALRAAAEGAEVQIITSDKDMLQLVSDTIMIYDPVKDRLLGRDAVAERFGVGPERVTEFLALTGDAVDNIPGVKGIGEKTAKTLLASCGSVEELLADPERIGKEKLRTLIVDNRETLLLSKRLATIDTKVPLSFSADALRPAQPDWETVLRFFRDMEFTSLMKLVPAAQCSSCPHKIISTVEELDSFLRGLSGEIAIDTESTGTDPLRDRLVGISFCAGSERAAYLPVGHTEASLGGTPQAGREEAYALLRPLLADPSIAKIGHNLKFDLALLRREGLTVQGMVLDTMIAAHLLNPNRPTQSLDETALEHLSRRKRPFPDVLGKRASFADVPINDAAAYAAEDALLAYELRQPLFGALEGEGIDTAYFSIEMPLIPVLLSMEEAGVRIDSGKLSGLAGQIGAEIAAVEKRVYFLAGEEFNINSPKQLAAVLFDKIGLTPTKKTKTGYSTGMDVLEELARFHELPREVLQYRSMTKLKTTYLDVLPTLVHPETGRVHTSFNQTATATGRLSSTDPNLQNIPVRGEWGSLIRSAFIADEGFMLLSADYSQVELRILAHLSGDPLLVDAFRQNADIHARTASEIYGVPVGQVTQEMRRTAKTVNFGVIYGMSSFGLSEALNIGRADAERYIRQYFERHPGVRQYTDAVFAAAARDGFVTTLFGRKRPVPEIQSRNRNVRSQGERLAINTPIQGSAAEIIKLAMIRIFALLQNGGFRSRMILQVHDELLFEVTEEEIDRVRKLVRAEMEHAAELVVPLKVEMGHGKNWAEAH